MTATSPVATAPTPVDDEQPLLPRLTMRQVRGVAWALAGLAVGARAWVAFQGYFVLDDYLFLIRSSIHPVHSAEFLLDPHFGHVMPAGHALTWLVNWAAPLSFPAFVMTSLALQCLAAGLAWRLLVTVFGHTPWLLLPFTVYVFSPLTMPSSVWWAAAVNALPLQVAMLLATTSHVRYLRAGSSRHLLATVGWTVVGLAFFEKALLIPLVLLAVSLVLNPERNPVRAVRQVLVRSRSLWLTLGAVCGVYVIAYLAATEPLGKQPDARYATTVLRLSATEAVVPALLGGPWRWVPDFLTPAAAPPVVLHWVALCGLAALVAVSCRRRAARRAWAVLVLYLLIDVGLLLAGRSAFPTLISQQYRYYADAALLVMLAVGTSVIPSAPGDPPRPAPEPGPQKPVGRLVAATAGALAVNLYVVSSLYSLAAFTELWQASPTKSYLTTAVSSLQAHPEVTVLDQDLPETVLWALYSDRRESMLFHRVRDRAAFSRSPTTLTVLDTDGHLRRGDIAGVETRPGPELGCGWRVAPGTSRIPLDVPLYTWYFTVALRYSAPVATSVRIGLDGLSRTWRLSPRESSRYLPVQGGGSWVTVTNLGTEPICVRGAETGLVVPLPGAPL